MQIRCGIQGSSPLLMNRFTDEDAAKVSSGTSISLASGHRGTPRERATAKLYTSADGRPMIPGPNVFSGLVAAGQFQKAGKRQLTSAKSSLVPAGLLVADAECMIENPFGPTVQWEVDSRSVVVPSTGGRVMCHRPRFDVWRISFTVEIDDQVFSESLVRRLVDDLGTKVGIGDYRPARKGPFGRFLVVSWKAEQPPVSAVA